MAKMKGITVSPGTKGTPSSNSGYYPKSHGESGAQHDTAPFGPRSKGGHGGGGSMHEIKASHIPGAKRSKGKNYSYD